VNLATANSILQSGVDDGVYTHAVYTLAVDGAVVATQPFGHATVDTVFDLASLTKPISTATLLLQSVERGELHLGEKVDTFFAATHGPLDHLADIDLLHLTTHLAGLPSIPDWPKAANSPRIDLIRSVVKTMRGRLPGAGYTYSDTGYILLGEILSLVTRTPLADLFRTRIADPAGLTTLGYLAPADLREHIAPTSTDTAVGTVHDPRARDLGGVAGHAGLFGTVDDVVRYLEIIRKGGAPLLSKASTALMSTSQVDPTVGAHSVGWFCGGNNLLPAGDLFSNRSFGHSGFTGCVALIDPAYSTSVVLLTNRVIAGDDNKRYLSLRRRFMNALAAAITS